MNSNFLAGLLRPIFWLAMVPLLAFILWLVRRFLPPKWERILFRKIIG